MTEKKIEVPVRILNEERGREKTPRVIISGDKERGYDVITRLDEDCSEEDALEMTEAAAQALAEKVKGVKG